MGYTYRDLIARARLSRHNDPRDTQDDQAWVRFCEGVMALAARSEYAGIDLDLTLDCDVPSSPAEADRCFGCGSTVPLIRGGMLIGEDRYPCTDRWHERASQSTTTPDSRHDTASGVALDVERRTVLLVQHKLTGRWQFPGGHIDPDEHGAEAAVREVREETGLEATVWVPDELDVRYGRRLPAPMVVAEHEAPADPSRGEPSHHHLDQLYVLTADWNQPLTAQEDEVNGVAWFDVDAIGQADVREDVPVLLAMAWRLVTGEELGTPEADRTLSSTEWCVFYGGEHPYECEGELDAPDQSEACELAQRIRGSGVARRTVTHGPWEVVWTNPACPACGVEHDEGEWRQLGMVCCRCHQHTGDNNQGHAWRFCKVTKTTREFHFCCPDDCELEGSR